MQTSHLCCRGSHSRPLAAAAKQAQAAQMGSAGTPAPMAAPSAAIAAKVNADAGGTNAVQNRYTMPNTAGLTFGGT